MMMRIIFRFFVLVSFVYMYICMPTLYFLWRGTMALPRVWILIAADWDVIIICQEKPKYSELLAG